MAVASANVATGVPSTDRMTSPGSMPASAAGGGRIAGRALGRHGRRNALRERSDGGRRRLHADAAEDDGEEHDRQQKVHERAAEHDDDPLPDRKPVEDALVVLALQSLVVGGARVLDDGGEEPAGRPSGLLVGRARARRGGYMPAIEM